MPQGKSQQKAGRGQHKKGRNALRCKRYSDRRHLERNKARRVKRFDSMVAESRERRATHGPYWGEIQRAARYAAKLAARERLP